ncbi:hypothetical protein GGE65_007715 [Skermanella aerolata]|uniref:hypothetical protein n=1 Tax=Skermanella aerolata TaxID=393310 RepID=UPI003D23106C
MTPIYTEDDVREIVMDAIIKSLRAIQSRDYMPPDVAEHIEDEIADLMEQAR